MVVLWSEEEGCDNQAGSLVGLALRGVLGKVCPLSPLSLNIYIMEMVEEIERAQLGVKLEDLGVGSCICGWHCAGGRLRGWSCRLCWRWFKHMQCGGG